MKSPSSIPLIFYFLNSTGSYLAVTKNDPTVHYSTSNLGKYLKKIRSRVEFNVFETPMGLGGYTGRQKYEHKRTGIEKYLFIPYSLSLVFPIVDAVYLSITRKESIFLLHPLFCLYTTFLILYFYLVKVFRIKHKIKLYGH